MRSRMPAGLEGHCPRCFLRKDWCICSEIPTIKTKTRYIIVRHHKEIMRSSNTGRLAALALQNHELLTYGQRDEPLDPSLFEREDIWLLFPKQKDGEVLEDDGPYPTLPPKHIVVLDGTWRQARRMAKRIPPLNSIPKIMIPTPTTFPERLRKAPHEWSLSTIEAIARSIEFFESEEKARQLDELFSLFVQHFKAQRGWKEKLPSFSKGM